MREICALEVKLRFLAFVKVEINIKLLKHIIIFSSLKSLLLLAHIHASQALLAIYRVSLRCLQLIESNNLQLATFATHVAGNLLCRKLFVCVSAYFKYRANTN